MEMILPGTINGWEDVDLENATLDDFRPLYAILQALEERAVAAGRYYWADFDHIDHFPTITTGYQNPPTIWFLHRRISQTIYEMAEQFINPEPALRFEINHGHDFPVRFTAFDIANSDHPCAALPVQGSSAATPGALATYRRFLADAKYWLGQFRYVYALDLGATPLKAFFKTVFPEFLPGVGSGALMAFTMSIDDFIITHFTTGAGIHTLSTKIYAEVKLGIKPEMYALSSIIFITVLVLLILVNKSRDIGRKYAEAAALAAMKEVAR